MAESLRNQSPVDPQDQNESNKDHNSIGNYFGRIKNALFNRSHGQNQSQPFENNKTQVERQEPTIEIETELIDSFDPMSNRFIKPEKRRRLSLMGLVTDEAVPRSLSTSLPSAGFRNKSYSSVINDSIKREEELDNDLERRKSIQDGYMSLITETEKQSRDESPCLNIPIETHSTQLSIDSDTNSNKDFFQLNPQERNKLVQLKLLRQSYEPRRKKAKYVTTPNESMSEVLGNSSMVNTSTQTHDLNYLDNKLNFKKRIASSQLTNRGKRQKKKGFQFTDFFYDTKDFENDKALGDRKIYANKVGKPKFNNKTTPSLGIKLDEDYNKPAFTSKKDQVFSNEKLSLHLDPEYVNKTKTIADVIKVKDDVISKGNKNPAKPSSGFKFNINPEKFNEILKPDSVEKYEEASVNKNDFKLNGSIEPKSKTGDLPNKFEDSRLSSRSNKRTIEEVDKNVDEKVSSTPSFSFINNSNNAIKKTSPTFSFGEKTALSNSQSTDKTSLFTKPGFKLSNNNEIKINQTTEGETVRTEPSVKPSGLFGPQKATTKDSASSIFTVDNGNDKVKGLFDSKSESASVSGNLFSTNKMVTQPDDKLKEAKSNDITQDGGSKKFTFDFTPNNDSKDSNSLSRNKLPENEKQPTPESNMFSLNKNNEQLKTPSFNFNTVKSISNDKGNLPNSTTNPLFGSKTSNKENDEVTNAKPLFDFSQKPVEEKDTTKVTELPNDTAKTPTANNTTSITNKPAFDFSFNPPPAKSQDDETTKNKDAKSDLEVESENVPKRSKFSFTSTEANKPSIPAFSFGTNVSEKGESKSPQPAFSFGSTTTSEDKDKTSSNDQSKQSEVAPPKINFNFAAPTSAPATTSNINTSNGFKFASGVTPPPANTNLFGNPIAKTVSPKPFSFPSTSTNTNTNLNTNTKSAFTFGQQPSTQQVNQLPFGFTNNNNNAKTNNNTNSITSSTENAFGSRPTTPAAFSFGNFNQTTSKTPVAPQFNFTGSKEPTPDPASMFGNHTQQGSREPTPFGGVSNNNVFGSINNSAFGSNNNNNNNNNSAFGAFGQLQQPQSATTPTSFGMNPTPSFQFNNGNNNQPISDSNTNINTTMNGFGGGIPTINPTPPSVNPRRIMHPRTRRR
ncbi:uncharacterized protein KGF55_002997 [Candida pseudojiufengensis]|uniref:uncharacterized protein n=1 Tax=Candida pseudojiufengensis TaxID=497109 RepID=UPI002224D90D|nr:uncharacterized protein KGF55_002997 [Candida pseudojiufengensis]KAI5963205.1 hypothetical protein KGF55_002997 [Candida pseudojiufengensis]